MLRDDAEQHVRAFISCVVPFWLSGDFTPRTLFWGHLTRRAISSLRRGCRPLFSGVGHFDSCVGAPLGVFIITLIRLQLLVLSVSFAAVAGSFAS